MKLTTILLLTASIIYSSWAYPAGGHPDDDVEVINTGNQQPGYHPQIPQPVPHYPLVPTIPAVPTVPLYPSYPYPTYQPAYPAYFPFAWSYNVFDGFSNLFSNIRSQASNAWSRVPSVRPLITTFWPDLKSNGTTTSTVKVVGDHKFIINETVHVQQSDFGHVIFKVRTVDIKPVDETTEGVDDDTTFVPEVEIDDPYTTQGAPEIDEDDKRPTVEDTGNIDGNTIGSPEILEDTNEISPETLENFELGIEKLQVSSEGGNDIKKQSLTIEKSEKIEFELPSKEIDSDEAKTEHLAPIVTKDKLENEEWAEIELGNSDEQKKTYYEVNNGENSSEEVENVTYDLTNDIAINQMLADQGASYNPDAELFDVNQYQPNSFKITSQEDKESQQESFDYLPYPHQTSDKRTSTLK